MLIFQASDCCWEGIIITCLQSSSAPTWVYLRFPEEKCQTSTLTPAWSKTCDFNIPHHTMLLKLTLLYAPSIWSWRSGSLQSDLKFKLEGWLVRGFMYSWDLIYLAPHVIFDEFDFNFQDDCGFSCHLMLCSCQVFD